MVKKHSFVLFVLSLILAFAPTVRAVELVISENGSGSESEISTQVETTTEVAQSNEAEVSNNVATDANTGGNEASNNTGGDVAIETGDVNQEVLVETSVNSSEVEVGCCPADTNAEISANGNDSQNTIDLTQTDETNIIVNQEAKVVNQVVGSANTGENSANENNGNVSIQTGDISVSGGIENGPINVADVSATSGGGDVEAGITGNGAGSNNSISASLSNQTNVILNFQANIGNDVGWDLNTGRNSANSNNGDVSIITGDIFFDFFIKNGPINIGGVDINCCFVFDPGDDGNGEDPGDGDNGEDPGDGGDRGGNGGGDGGGGDGGGGNGGVGGVGPQVIGLSDTTSKAARTLIFWCGLAMIVYGLKLIGQETSAKIRFNNAK